MRGALAACMALCFAFSCASTKDLESARVEIATLRQDNRDMRSALDGFLAKYDAELRAELDKNMRATQARLAEANDAASKASEDSGSVSRFLEAARADRAETYRNRMESETLNVVNEFQSLKALWETSRKYLELSAGEARDAAIDSEVQAKSAYRTAAEVGAKLARIEALSKSLSDSLARLDAIEGTNEALAKRQRAADQALEGLGASISSTNQRVVFLEKATLELAAFSKRLDAVDLTIARIGKRLDQLEKAGVKPE
jgi:hypothetical protein